MNFDPLITYNFLFELPLYTTVEVAPDINKEKFRVMLNLNRIDGYNPILKDTTTFQIEWHFNHALGKILSQSNLVVLRCLRTSEEFHIHVKANLVQQTIQKVGQYPSIADFHISQIKEYNKVLNSEKLREFTRAIGLAANGVGIGSFVYLRRIFEGLIEDAHQLAVKTEHGWNEDKYQRNRIADRIEQLRHELPEFLVENKSLYSILSLGIHQLSEQECLEHFETVKVGIELILDEKLEKYNKQKKIELAKVKIASATQQGKPES